MDYLKQPIADPTTLEELVKIILVNREDAKKNYRSIRGALVNYNRHGQDSRYLRLLPSEAIQKLTVDELHAEIQGLLSYRHTISYTGSIPLDEMEATLKAHHPISEALVTPPPYYFLKTRVSEKTEILFFHKELAQSQVDIEFGGEDYTEANNPAIQLYNAYFAGGMSGIVFQELREARALAYSTFARYTTGRRKGEQNQMWGYIACQSDKTPEAVEALIDLIDNHARSRLSDSTRRVNPESIDIARRRSVSERSLVLCVLGNAWKSQSIHERLAMSQFERRTWT